MRVEAVGYAAAALITTGVIVPLGLDIARLTNFAGYVSGCAWLVAMAIVLWHANPHAGRAASATATARRSAIILLPVYDVVYEADQYLPRRRPG